MGKFTENPNSPIWGLIKWLRTLADRSNPMFWSNLLAMGCMTPACVCLLLYGERGYVLFLAGAVVCFALASPALAALFFVCMQAVRENPTWVWDSFKGAYRRDWKKAMPLGLLVAVLWTGYFRVLATAVGNTVVNASILVVLAVAGILLSGFSFFLFQQLATVELPLHKLLQNGMLLVLAGKGRSLAVSVMTFAAVLAGAWFSYISWFVLMLGALALLVMTGELIFCPVFEELFLDKE